MVQAASPQATSSEPYTNMKASDLAKKEHELTSFPLMASVKDTIRTLDNAQVEMIEPGRAANLDNVKRVEGIVKESDWEYLFPMRAASYTYSNFLKAVGKFPALCKSYNDGRDSDAICRKELATMFAHFAQKPAAMKAGVRRLNGVRRWFTSVRWAGVKGRKGVTTANVTGNLAGPDLAVR
jgi:chitodextrinase